MKAWWWNGVGLVKLADTFFSPNADGHYLTCRMASNTKLTPNESSSRFHHTCGRYADCIKMVSLLILGAVSQASYHEEQRKAVSWETHRELDSLRSSGP